MHEKLIDLLMIIFMIFFFFYALVIAVIVCQAPSSILESLETHMNGLEDVKGGKKG